MGELNFVVEEPRDTVGAFMKWVARIAVAAAFVFIGATKFNSDPNAMWVKLFEQIGWGQWFRYFTGAMQVTGGLLLLTRWTLTAGAIMLACTMIGAMVIEVFVQHAVGFVLVSGSLLGIIGAIWFSGQR